MEAEIIGQAVNGNITEFASTISNPIIIRKKGRKPKDSHVIVSCKGKKKEVSDENTQILEDFDRINADRGKERSDKNDNDDVDHEETSEPESHTELPHKKLRKMLHDVTNDLTNKRTCGVCSEIGHNARTCPQRNHH